MPAFQPPAKPLPKIFGLLLRQTPARAVANPRIAFVDSARGLLVLLMVASAASVLPMGGIEKAGLARLAEFTSTFTAPAFFLLAGVFLHRSMRRPWPMFFLQKVAPLIWRYVLWAGVGTLIGLWLRAPLSPALLLRALGRIVIDPPAMLLIVCALPLSFVGVRLLRGLPILLVMPIAAALEIAHLSYGGLIPASFCRLFVYLYIGHVFAPEIRTLARYAVQNRTHALYGLIIGALLNAFAAFVTLPFVGVPLASLPFASLALGLCGAAATIVLASLLEVDFDTSALRWIGQRALGLYFAGFVLVEALQAAALKLPAGFPSGAVLLFAGASVLSVALIVAFVQRRGAAPSHIAATSHIEGGKPMASMASGAAPQ